MAACRATAYGSARVVEATTTRWPAATSRHQSQISAANASGSGRVTVACELGEVLAQVRAQATRGRTRARGSRPSGSGPGAPSGGRSARPGSIHDTASRSNSSSVARCHASSRSRPPDSDSGVLLTSVGRQRAAQREHVSLGVAVLADRRGQLLPLAVAAAHGLDRRRRRLLQLRHDVAGDRIGVTGPHRRGVQCGQLADRLPGLVGVGVEGGVGNAGRTLRPVCGSSV